ncbi:YsaB family lipoprotein [Enterobacter asburiae]
MSCGGIRRAKRALSASFDADGQFLHLSMR